MPTTIGWNAPHGGSFNCTVHDDIQDVMQEVNDALASDTRWVRFTDTETGKARGFIADSITYLYEPEGNTDG